MSVPYRRFTLIGFGVALAMTSPVGRLALAAEGPYAESSSQTLRDFSLRNETDKTIVDAHAFTTKGKDIAVTQPGRIRPRLSQNFSLQQSECLDRVEVKFEDGQTMRRDQLNDCTSPRLVARADGITVETGAGGPIHPSAGSRNNQGAKTP